MSTVTVGVLADPQAQRDRWVRAAWVAALGALIAGPALLWLAVAPPAPMWDRLAVITGLFALTALVCAAVVPSRIRSLNRAFGIESVIEVHRFLGISAAVLVLAHLACVVALDPVEHRAAGRGAQRPAARSPPWWRRCRCCLLVGAAGLRKRLRLPLRAVALDPRRARRV